MFLGQKNRAKCVLFILIKFNKLPLTEHTMNRYKKSYFLMITAGFFRETLNFAHILVSAVVLRAGTAGVLLEDIFSNLHTCGTMQSAGLDPLVHVGQQWPEGNHSTATLMTNSIVTLTERRKCLCEAAAVCRWIHVLREYLCQWDRNSRTTPPRNPAPFICPSAVTRFSQLHTALCYLYSKWWWRWVTLPLNQLITGCCVSVTEQQSHLHGNAPWGT